MLKPDGYSWIWDDLSDITSLFPFSLSTVGVWKECLQGSEDIVTRGLLDPVHNSSFQEDEESRGHTSHRL